MQLDALLGLTKDAGRTSRIHLLLLLIFAVAPPLNEVFNGNKVAQTFPTIQDDDLQLAFFSQ